MKEKLFYKIGQVARMTDLKPFVLRYWETEFSFLMPEKTPKGQRIYRQADVDLIMRLKELLHEQGFTIAGARRLLEDEMAPKKKKSRRQRPLDRTLAHVTRELKSILTMLKRDV